MTVENTISHVDSNASPPRFALLPRAFKHSNPAHRSRDTRLALAHCRVAATRAWRSIAHASGIADIETLNDRALSAGGARCGGRAALRSAGLARHARRRERAAQRSLTSLMQRRDAWEAADVARFTDLTSREHTLAGSIEAALRDGTACLRRCDARAVPRGAPVR